MAETVGFEPTVPVKVQLISSQSRYDHFDTSPYMLTRIREVNALFNFIRILIRTQRVLKLLVCGKPAWLKALLSFDFSKQRNISSYVILNLKNQLRYYMSKTSCIGNYSNFEAECQEK